MGRHHKIYAVIQACFLICSPVMAEIAEMAPPAEPAAPEISADTYYEEPAPIYTPAEDFEMANDNPLSEASGSEEEAEPEPQTESRDSSDEWTGSGGSWDEDEAVVEPENQPINWAALTSSLLQATVSSLRPDPLEQQQQQEHYQHEVNFWEQMYTTNGPPQYLNTPAQAAAVQNYYNNNMQILGQLFEHEVLMAGGNEEEISNIQQLFSFMIQDLQQSTHNLPYPLNLWKPFETMSLQEGNAVFINNISGHFTGTYLEYSAITVSGLPPGLSFENNAIIGQLAAGSAGNYSISVNVYYSDVDYVTAYFTMNVSVPEGGFQGQQISQMLGDVQNQDNQLNLANQMLDPYLTLDAELDFTLNFSAISNIPPLQNYFNCDSFSTATMLAAAESNFYVYEFAFAITTSGGKLIPHELNVVYLGLSGNLDVYAFWEPQQGTFISTFVTPASSEHITSIPDYAFQQYLMASGFLPQGQSVQNLYYQQLSLQPSIYSGNYHYYIPGIWEDLTHQYLPAYLSQSIIEGLSSIQQTQVK